MFALKNDSLVIKSDEGVGLYPLLLTLGDGKECGVQSVGVQQKPRNFEFSGALALLTIPTRGDHAAILMFNDDDGSSEVLDVELGQTLASDKNFSGICDVNNGIINLQDFIAERT